MSATTPDVGEIAKELWIARYDNYSGFVRLVGQHVAQAREPLVKELRNIAEADIRTWDKGFDSPLDFMRWAQSRARTALTDTEET